MRTPVLSLAFVVLCAACVSAQPRPGAFTTVVTTDTSVTSVCVGGNTITAPSSCLGGLQAGPTVVNQAMTLPSFTPGVTTNKLYNVGGTLTWNGLAVAVGGAVGPGTLNKIALFTGENSVGDSVISQAGTVITIAGTLASTVFGASSFTAGGVGDQSLTVRNTTAGVANRGVVFVGNDASAFLGKFAANSSTFTTSGADIANGVKLEGQGVGGLSLSANNAAGIIHFFTNTGTTERGQITAAGLWNWTTFGAHLFTAGAAGANSLTIKNTTAGAGNSGQFIAASDTVTTSLVSLSSTYTTAGALVQGGSVLFSDGVGGISIDAAHASGAVRIYTGSATLRATFDAAGNFNLGSTNIMDSPAVPTLGAGFGGGATIAGRDFAFIVTAGTSAVTASGVVNFNTTYTNTPACTANADGTAGALFVGTSTTTVTVGTVSGSNIPNSTRIFVLCRGF